MYIFAPLFMLALSASVRADCASDFEDPGATDTVTNYWQFAAYDPAKSTTVGLRLFAAKTAPGTTWHVLAAGTGTIPWAGFKLESGEPTAYPPSTGVDSYLAPVHYIGLEAPPSGSAIYPTPAPFLLFANTFAPPPGAFCSIPSPAGGNNLISLNGHFNQFSLCNSVFDSFSGNTLLVGADTESVIDGFGTYDGSSCYPVEVWLVPV